MIELAIHDRRVVATLARNAQNTIDDALADAIESALDETEQRGRPVLHLRSSTPNFCGGADPARVRAWMNEGREGAAAVGADGARWSRLFERIESSPVIAIAEIRGNALGAGLGLALACDLRIAGETARIGVPEVRVGLLPAGMTVRRLHATAGVAVAQRLLIGGELIDGIEAHRCGIVHWVVADAALQEAAAATAERVAKQSAAALTAAKRVIASSARDAVAVTAALERNVFAAMLSDADSRGRIDALLGRLAAREGA